MSSATAWLCCPWARHLIESRAQLDADFRVFPTQNGRLCGANLLEWNSSCPPRPRLIRGYPNVEGWLVARLCHLVLGHVHMEGFIFCWPPAPHPLLPPIPSRLGACSVPCCCPAQPK